MPGPYHPLVESWKSIAAPIEWSSPPDPDDGGIGFLVPLELRGVVVAELALRGAAYGHIADSAVTLQLEVGMLGKRTRIPLVRIDWKPKNDGHKNPDRRILTGTHAHKFHPNWLEADQRMRTGNLPWAEKPHDINTFSDLLDYAKILFRISNIDNIPVPEWSLKLI